MTASRQRAEGRRREVERRLAAAGLAGGGRRPARDAGAAGIAPLLRPLLAELGGGFALFGLHLSSRPDLLPLSDCRELAQIGDRSPEMPAAAVAERIRHALGRSPDERFLSFDVRPFASFRLHQLHAARLRDGRAVRVKLARPIPWEPDLDLLALVAQAAAGIAGLPPLHTAVDDFAASLRQGLDLAAEAAGLAALAADAEPGGDLCVPQVHAELCGTAVLTLEALPGVPLDALAPGHPGGPHLARRLAGVWLRQALQGTRFPAELRAAEVLALPDGRIAITGGVFASLPPSSQENLWEYLTAAAAHDPDRAFSRLLGELAAAADERLRSAFRQAVPYREGGWRDGGDDDTLAEHLFVQWRLASAAGHPPPPPLLAFYRGLCAAAVAGRALAVAGDPLAGAVRDLRLTHELERIRRFLAMPDLSGALAPLAAGLLKLPRRLEEALDSPRSSRDLPPTAPARSARGDAMARMAALGLLLAGLLGLWNERLVPLAFLLLGALLLRSAGRHD